MAPRAPETFDHFVERLRKAMAAGQSEVRFGQHHFSHAVCRETDGWCVRRLECSAEDAEAYMAEHGMFMPENAEELSKPTSLLYRGDTLDDVIGWLGARPWPV